MKDTRKILLTHHIHDADGKPFWTIAVQNSYRTLLLDATFTDTEEELRNCLQFQRDFLPEYKKENFKIQEA